MSTSAQQPPEGLPEANVEELELEAARTRAELGETVDALTAKLDVRSRARQELDVQRERAQHVAAEARRTLTDERGRPVPQVWVAGGAAALASVVGVLLLVRSRRR